MTYTWVFDYEEEDVVMGSGKRAWVDEESGEVLIIEGPEDDDPD